MRFLGKQSNDPLREFAELLSNNAERPNLHNYKPHTKQKVFHESELKKKVFVGGNRSGKTTGGTVESLYWLRGSHPYRSVPPPPIRSRAVAVDFKDGVERILKPEFQRWIPPSLLKKGSWSDSFNSYTNTLHLTNGSFIEFMSYEQDLEKFAGTSRHFVYFDEEPPKSIFNENRMRLIDTDGSYWITMTPVLGMTWLYDELYLPAIAGIDKTILVVGVSITDNPHLRQEAIETAFEGMDADERAARYEGEFRHVGGFVFRNFGERHVVAASKVPVSLLRNYKWYASVDPGLRNPTAWLWHAVHPNGTVITFHEHYRSDMTIKEHAAYIKQRNNDFGRDPDGYIGDPALKQRMENTGLSRQLEYSLHGIPIVLGNNDVDSGINKMRQYVDSSPPMWYISDACPNLIKEMRRYRWDVYKNAKLRDENNLKEKPKKKDDHAVDSSRYFFSFMPNLEYELPGTPDNRLELDALLQAGTPLHLDNRVDRRLRPQPRVDEDWTVYDENMGAMY